MSLRPRSVFARRAAMVLALGFGALAADVPAQAPAAEVRPGRVPTPAIERGRGEQCVADPAYMRRNHMTLLNHQRDETVHRGVRDPRSSLKGCIGCHASAETGSVAVAKTDFCISCHSYAAVKVDCFQCHSSKPQTTAFLPLNHPHGSQPASKLAAQWRQLSAPSASVR